MDSQQQVIEDQAELAAPAHYWLWVAWAVPVQDAAGRFQEATTYYATTPDEAGLNGLRQLRQQLAEQGKLMHATLFRRNERSAKGAYVVEFRKYSETTALPIFTPTEIGQIRQCHGQLSAMVGPMGAIFQRLDNRLTALEEANPQNPLPVAEESACVAIERLSSKVQDMMVHTAVLLEIIRQDSLTAK